jgi:hypothetical protein
MTTTRAELKELLLATDACVLVNGHLRDIKAKAVGAGVYRVTLGPPK